jgi:hypothetical protein
MFLATLTDNTVSRYSREYYNVYGEAMINGDGSTGLEQSYKATTGRYPTEAEIANVYFNGGVLDWTPRADSPAPIQQATTASLQVVTPEIRPTSPSISPVQQFAADAAPRLPEGSVKLLLLFGALYILLD